MRFQLDAVCLAALDPDRLARFWSRVLGCEAREATGGRIDLLPDGETGFKLGLVPGGSDKLGQNLVHLDLTNGSADDQHEAVARALEGGGRHADVGQRGDEGHVVLADPEGNEFCEIEAGNGFLADTGRIGAVNCDGTRALGCFWSAVLGWPLVWDQDEETAIQSPHGGSKITWSGPPLLPRPTADRWWFEVSSDGGRDTARQRLRELGATVGSDGSQTLRDPDGNLFRLLD